MQVFISLLFSLTATRAAHTGGSDSIPLGQERTGDLLQTCELVKVSRHSRQYCRPVVYYVAQVAAEDRQDSRCFNEPECRDECGPVEVRLCNATHRPHCSPVEKQHCTPASRPVCHTEYRQECGEL